MKMDNRDLDRKIHVYVMKQTIEADSGIKSRAVEPVPKYSTSLDCAFKVVEELRKDFYFDLSDSPNQELWFARFSRKWDFSVYYESAPTAICLAALKAVGFDVTDFLTV